MKISTLPNGQVAVHIPTAKGEHTVRAKVGATLAEVRAALKGLDVPNGPASGIRRVMAVKERLEAAGLLSPAARARKPLGDRKTARLVLRLSTGEHAAIRARAGEAGQTVTAYVVERCAK